MSPNRISPRTIGTETTRTWLWTMLALAKLRPEMPMTYAIVMEIANRWTTPSEWRAKTRKSKTPIRPTKAAPHSE